MNIDKKNSLFILLVIIVCNLSLFAQSEDIGYKLIEPNQVPSVLSMLASATQNNFEKINTWQGVISHNTIETTRGEKAKEYLSKYTEAEPKKSINEIQRFYNKNLEFKIDVANDKFFSISDSTEPFIYMEPHEGKAYTANWGPDELIFIATSEYEIKMIPLESKHNVVKNRLARKYPRGAFRMTDPRDVFNIGSKTLWLTLSQLSQHLQTPDIEHFGVVIKEKANNGKMTYRVEISDPAEGFPFQIIVLSGEVGFNCTLIQNWYDGDTLMSEITTEFVNHQGIFLPKKWEKSQYYQDGGLMRQEFNTIEQQETNKPIQESTFSAQNYLNEGGKLRDRIAGKEYKRKNGKLLEISRKSKD